MQNGFIRTSKGVRGTPENPLEFVLRRLRSSWRGLNNLKESFIQIMVAQFLRADAKKYNDERLLYCW